MRHHRLLYWLFVVFAGANSARAEMVTRRLVRLPGGQNDVVRFDLTGTPRNTHVYRADLRLSGWLDLPGGDARLKHVDIIPLLGGERGTPLELRGPWYDRLDATPAVRAWVAGVPHEGFLVRACPRGSIAFLDLVYEGQPGSLPRAVPRIEVLHRQGQTFIRFEEIDDRSAELAPTWGTLQRRLDELDAESEVRYRVYRHDEPITPASLPQAEWLGDVKPMSGYNVRGRSVDELIALHRRRAIDDLDFSKQLASSDYFARYRPDMPDMQELPVPRLAVEDGKPLPARTGLYVHQPPSPGTAYYTVVSVVDGVANTTDLPAAPPIQETVGSGEPVLQGKASVKVFYDYPGERCRYVTWAAPPCANLPNQYSNWGVFVPASYDQASPRRLSIFFHDYRERYLKPPWPHRRDTVLLSAHDAPYRSFGYGYHEALGTLRSFRQGRVRPFFARQVDLMREWALREFRADPTRVSCGGRGYWGGTTALQYGLRRPGQIAYVLAEASPAPDPQQTPHEFSYYGRGDVRRTKRPDMEAVWGHAEWQIEAESGRPIWEEVNLVALVRSRGDRETFPYLSLGAGSMHLTWKQETDLMKAYLDTRNPFMAEFFWGSSAHRPLPVTAATGDFPFEPRTGQLVLVANARERSPNPQFFEQHFATGKRGYGGGSRLNTRPRWDSSDIIDTADRLEVTIYAARRVVYAGRVSADVVIRDTQEFRPSPGEKLTWILKDPAGREREERGEARVTEKGFIEIDALEFGGPRRLVVNRGREEERR